MVIEFPFLTAFFAVGFYESLYSGLLFLVLQVEVLLKYHIVKTSPFLSMIIKKFGK